MDRYKRAKSIVEQIASLTAEEKEERRVYVSIFDFDLMFDYDASKFKALEQEYTYTPTTRTKRVVIDGIELVEASKIPQGSFSVGNDPYELRQFDNYE